MYLINAPEGEVIIKVSADERKRFKNEELVDATEENVRLAKIYPSIFIEVEDQATTSVAEFLAEYTDEEIAAEAATLNEEDTPGPEPEANEEETKEDE